MAIARALIFVTVVLAEQEPTETCDDNALLQTRAVSQHKVPECAWDKNDLQCPSFKVGKFTVGKKNVDTCPDGTAVVTDAADCESAATLSDREFQASSTGEGKCFWCGGCDKQNFGMSTDDEQRLEWAKLICQDCPGKENIPDNAWVKDAGAPSFTMGCFTVGVQGDDCPAGLSPVLDVKKCKAASKLAGVNNVLGRLKNQGGYRKPKNGDPCFWAANGAGQFQMNGDAGSGAKMICQGR